MKAPVRRGLRRESFHILGGTVMGVLTIFVPWLVLVILLGVASAGFLAMELLRFGDPSFNRRFVAWAGPLARKQEEARITGSTYFLLGSFITVLAFPEHIAATAILFAAWGDPVATVVGTRWGRIRFGGRSLEGHLACLIVCVIIGVVMGFWFADLPLMVAVVGAIVATILEAAPILLNDNVVIPVGSGLVMTLVSLVA